MSFRQVFPTITEQDSCMNTHTEQRVDHNGLKSFMIEKSYFYPPLVLDQLFENNSQGLFGAMVRV